MAEQYHISSILNLPNTSQDRRNKTSDKWFKYQLVAKTAMLIALFLNILYWNNYCVLLILYNLVTDTNYALEGSSTEQ